MLLGNLIARFMPKLGKIFMGRLIGKKITSFFYMKNLLFDLFILFVVKIIYYSYFVYMLII